MSDTTMQFANLFDDDRGVSPVIGVILMVAITVILAAVIGTFVLGLTDSVSASATAGVDVESDGGSSYDVTVVSMGENTQHVTCDGGTNTAGVGDTITCSSGDAVVAIGEGDTKDAVVRTLD